VCASCVDLASFDDFGYIDDVLSFNNRVMMLRNRLGHDMIVDTV
jgi:hypothetical protein